MTEKMTVNDAESESGKEIKVLMVCLGNICRSPMAEATFAHLSIHSSLLATPMYTISVDSAGTAAYHVGESPDPRTVSTCKAHGVRIDSRARALKVQDFWDFTHVVAMDTNNLRNILSLRPPNSPAHVSLFSHWSSNPKISEPATKTVIVDPYYGGNDGFETCYQQCVEYSRGFLDRLREGRMEEVRSVTEGLDEVNGKVKAGRKSGKKGATSGGNIVDR